MAAFVAVDSDPGPNYGKFTILQLPRDTQINGVEQVGNNFESFPDAAKELSLFRQGGSQVTLGNLLALPVADGFLFVEPVYVQAAGGTSYPLLKRVFASFGESIAYAPTLQQALDAVFKGSSGVSVGTPQGPPTSTTTNVPSAALQAAVAQLNAAQAAAQQALKAGDLAGYARAEAQVAAAIKAINTATTKSAPSPKPSAATSPAPAPSGQTTPPGPSP
jgi:hypothetical protein